MNDKISPEITLLSKKQVFGNQELEVIKRIGTKYAVTDFAILLGGFACREYHIPGDNSLKGRTCWWYSLDFSMNGNLCPVDERGERHPCPANWRPGGIRPILPYSGTSNILKNAKRNNIIHKLIIKCGKIIYK